MKRICSRLYEAVVVICFLFFVFVGIVYGWGRIGHWFVNREAVVHLPLVMNAFKSDSLFFEAHAYDAEVRIDESDTSFYAEWPRHFFAIDDYPNFYNLPHDLDSMIMLFGRSRVRQSGLNPWATTWALDSMTAQLIRGDFDRAKLTASDLGHYVADAHQPLRCTYNNDGTATNNHGINYRYENAMLGLYESELRVSPDSVRYIASPIDFAFEYIYHTYTLVDSVLDGDNYAKWISGWNGTGTPPTTYYSALWAYTKNFTQDQFQRATVNLACLWYTAWVNAGLASTPDEFFSQLPKDVQLYRNYPNPFNSSTTISYALPRRAYISLTILSIDGKEILTLVDEHQNAGLHTTQFNNSAIASGVYLYRLEVGSSASLIGKMILLK